MAEMVGDWLHFDGRQSKRKRAQVTCVDCHARKVRCDLQARTAQGQSGCSNCVTAERSCHLRPSKRTKHTRNSDRQQVHGFDEGGDRRGSPLSPSLENDVTESINVGFQAAPEPDPQIEPHVALLTASSPRRHFQQQQNQQNRQNHYHYSKSPQSQQTAGGHPSRSHDCPTAQSNPSDVDTGFLQIYGPENQHDAEQQESLEKQSLERNNDLSDAQQQELQEIFAETYLEFCYAWCPVLDMDTLAESASVSPLLANALAVAASHIRPPLIPHEGPGRYYKRATNILYNDEEPDGTTTLQAIALFYWWAPRPPVTARRHSSWWWTSVLIRQAQQMNYHRDPGPGHPLREPRSLSLRRRIWWTAFARERLTALCQSKPCIIDPDDCNVPELTLADFPDDPTMQRKGEVFIYWVRLCAIIGRIAKTLSRSGSSTAASLPSATHLRQELVDWVHSIPPHLRLPIDAARTRWFDRDVHQLYLPYLTTIIVLHLRRSTHALPQALPPAILAASCIVRILKDILSRGDARFLMAITCWYSGTAFIALLQACRIENLRRDANEGLDVLTNAVEQLQNMWGSANVVRRGFDRLRDSNNNGGAGAGAGAGDDLARLEANVQIPYVNASGSSANVDLNRAAQEAISDIQHQDFDWTQLFPFVTRETSSIAGALLPSTDPGIPTRLPSPEDMILQDTFTMDYQGLLEPFTDFTDFGFIV